MTAVARWGWLGAAALAVSLCLSQPSIAQQPAPGQALAPFETDGCSAFPDGNRADQQLWQDCCIAHDLAYWAGGSQQDRQAVDEALAECVADLDQSATAKLMLLGVRVGGSPYFPTSYRWGYGWPYVRGYQPLSEAEKQQVMTMIDQVTVEALRPKSRWWYLEWVPWSSTDDATGAAPFPTLPATPAPVKPD